MTAYGTDTDTDIDIDIDIDTDADTDAGTATGEGFLDLLCRDPDLLRAEFEEIIAAAWPPTRPPARGDRGPSRPVHSAQHGLPARPRDRRRRRYEQVVGRAGRQRSPPAAGSCER